MDVGSGGPDSGRGLLLPMVLATAGVAQLPRRGGGGGALGVGSRDSIRAGVRGCSTPRLGLQVDGTRNTRACRLDSCCMDLRQLIMGKFADRLSTSRLRLPVVLAGASSPPSRGMLRTPVGRRG